MIGIFLITVGGFGVIMNAIYLFINIQKKYKNPTFPQNNQKISNIDETIKQNILFVINFLKITKRMLFMGDTTIKDIFCFGNMIIGKTVFFIKDKSFQITFCIKEENLIQQYIVEFKIIIQENNQILIDPTSYKVNPIN